YTVDGALNMPHMPSTGVSGIDLYSIDSNGKKSFCFGNYSFGDTISYTFTNLGKDPYHDRGFEYRIYLPLYNSVKWMEIGIPKESNLEFIPLSTEKPIVLYGTSIAQGACASRPAMAWGNILQRSLEYPLINLGFSGNGRLEKEVLNFVGEPDARLFILDCLPNLTSKTEAEVTKLVIDAVKQLRQSRTAPILLVEHAGYSNAPTNDEMCNKYTCANKGSRKAYESLLAEKIENLHYLSCEELNFPADAWVDHVHPSDFGMQQQAYAVEKKVREILHIPLGKLPTTIPITQRREPRMYEWQARHRTALEYLVKQQPKAVIIGNSITHYWGGEPANFRKNGPKAWDKVMRPAGFLNLGCGWDRIENVLWRIYHGELDGYQAEKVVLMIGTNNMGLNSDAEIVEGLRLLVSAIHQRQPKANIKVVGILPRRKNEKWVKDINLSIKQMVKKEGYIFANPGISLLKKDGKIDESLFIDGLHPNEKGYSLIAEEIAR
ncbi:MAG: SGNH/GDSL hydrolase family protein, partial [Bacteroides sp.]